MFGSKSRSVRLKVSSKSFKPNLEDMGVRDAPVTMCWDFLPTAHFDDQPDEFIAAPSGSMSTIGFWRPISTHSFAHRRPRRPIFGWTQAYSPRWRPK